VQSQLARQFGIDEDKVGGLTEMLAPALAQGTKRQAQGQQYLDQILGSREASGELATEAANRSGINLGAVMQFLPAIAAMLQGGMQRNLPDSSIQGMLSGAGGSGGGLMGAIGDFLGGGGSQGSGGSTC